MVAGVGAAQDGGGGIGLGPQAQAVAVDSAYPHAGGGGARHTQAEHYAGGCRPTEGTLKIGHMETSFPHQYIKVVTAL